MKFYLVNRFDLKFLGKAYDGCYLKFNAITYKDAISLSEFKDNEIKASQEGIKILQDSFIGGVILDENQKESKIDGSFDISDLPIIVINKAMLFLVSTSVEEKKD